MKKISKKTQTRKSISIASYPRRAADAFVNQKMLYGIRDELKAHVDSKIHGVRSEFHDLRFELHNLRAEMQEFRSEVEARFEKIDAKFEVINSKIENLTSAIHRMNLLAEEQNNRNKIVLDGLSHLFGRQDRLESQFIEFKK